MADKFIDQDETQIYGPYASRHIRARLLGIIPAYDPALHYVTDRIDAATATMAAAVSAAREKDADRRKGAQGKAPILKGAKQLLGKFSQHLSGHDPGSVDRKVFFPKDGTARGAGSSAQDVLLAVLHVAARLEDPKSPVRDAAHWRERFDAAAKALASVVAFAEDARVERQSLTPEVEAARQAWLNGYQSAKALVESLLRQLGRLEQMPLFFHDLNVPSGARVTEAPPDPPQTLTAPEEDETEEA
ncbi:hypothetical protein [Polyangium aurulentum]|uniref:hypothetical protein n=1 Tax=Polyangium aurulentum TaxID=2567896 RepID=UPI0010AE703E|nr:hypothetical protein [Polyangium aurulentum]UQA57224.1 hypothetical protein E8A73_038955 [Polyangium aurulentum]